MAATLPPKARRQRLGLIAAALVAWVAVVVVGSGGDAADSLLGVEQLEVLWLAAMGLLALLGLVLLIKLNPFSGEWTEPATKKRRPWGLMLLILFALVIWKPDLLDGLAAEDTTEDESTAISGAAPAASDDGSERPEPIAQATDVLVMLAIAAALGGAWVMLTRRVSAGQAEAFSETGDEHAPIALETALEQASAVLRDTADPRLAVMQSYALLEAALADHGLTRDPTATSTEHLERALQRLRIDPAPVRGLGRLYERARFSDHTITQTDKRDAADALDVTRQELAVRL